MIQMTSHADDPAAAPNASDSATAAATGNPDPNAASLLQQTPGDWMPEKYRTFKDGTQDLDLDASARKLADAHKSLEQRMGQGGLLPATPEEYKLEGLNDDINVEEVRKDPMFQNILKAAHEAKIPQESVNFFFQKYFNELAPELFKANAVLTAQEAKVELGKAWGGDANVAQNLQLANRAFNGFAAQGDGAGSVNRLIEKFGTDPDFLVFAAAIGKEMQEDTPITEGSQAGTDWQSQVDAIRANPAYSDSKHPQHAGLKQQMEGLYQKRYGTQLHRLGGGTTR